MSCPPSLQLLRFYFKPQAPYSACPCLQRPTTAAPLRTVGSPHGVVMGSQPPDLLVSVFITPRCSNANVHTKKTFVWKVPLLITTRLSAPWPLPDILAGVLPTTCHAIPRTAAHGCLTPCMPCELGFPMSPRCFTPSPPGASLLRGWRSHPSFQPLARVDAEPGATTSWGLSLRGVMPSSGDQDTATSVARADEPAPVRWMLHPALAASCHLSVFVLRLPSS
jgi:hypothetical protein